MKEVGICQTYTPTIQIHSDLILNELCYRVREYFPGAQYGNPNTRNHI